MNSMRKRENALPTEGSALWCAIAPESMKPPMSQSIQLTVSCPQKQAYLPDAWSHSLSHCPLAYLS